MEVVKERITEIKTKVTSATEIITVLTRRKKEVETLVSRTTITTDEKTKLTAELK